MKTPLNRMREDLRWLAENVFRYGSTSKEAHVHPKDFRLWKKAMAGVSFPRVDTPGGTLTFVFDRLVRRGTIAIVDPSTRQVGRA